MSTPLSNDLVSRLRDYVHNTDDVPLRMEAAARIEALEKLDREAATYVESVICMRTHFTGEPPYVGWKGLGLALSESLDRLAMAEQLLRTGLELMWDSSCDDAEGDWNRATTKFLASLTALEQNNG